MDIDISVLTKYSYLYTKDVDIPSKYIAIVDKYCKYYDTLTDKERELVNDKKQIKGNILHEKYISELSNIPLVEIFDLVNCCDKLRFNALTNTLVYLVSNVIAGHTKEEIYKIFDITKDLTDEDLINIEKEIKFLSIEEPDV